MTEGISVDSDDGCDVDDDSDDGDEGDGGDDDDDSCNGGGDDDGGDGRLNRRPLWMSAQRR